MLTLHCVERCIVTPTELAYCITDKSDAIIAFNYINNNNANISVEEYIKEALAYLYTK